MVDGDKIDAVLQIFLLGFHALDFSVNAGDFLLRSEDFANISGALLEHSFDTPLGLAGIFEAPDEVAVRWCDFLALFVSISARPRDLSSASAARSCGAGMPREAWSGRAAFSVVATLKSAE